MANFKHVLGTYSNFCRHANSDKALKLTEILIMAQSLEEIAGMLNFPIIDQIGEPLNNIASSIDKLADVIEKDI